MSKRIGRVKVQGRELGGVGYREVLSTGTGDGASGELVATGS